MLDIRRYQQVDAKLGAIHAVRRDGDDVVFTFRPRLLGLPGPLTTQRVLLTSPGRIEVTGMPSWTDALARFAASFTLREDATGTQVTRRLEFTFPRPLRWALDPVFGRWLRGEVPRELAAAKAFLEREA